jgi:TonB family protein
MRPKPQTISGSVPEENRGSLRGCLVDGDAEQRMRERSIRRRALVISVALQSLILATIVLVPLFGKTQRIAFAHSTPIPPYSLPHGAPRDPARPQPSGGPPKLCHFCAPTNIPPTIVTRDSNSAANQTDNAPPEGFGDLIPGAPDGPIQIGDRRQRRPDPQQIEHQIAQPHRMHVTTLDPAMLQRRVEPFYPPLARQIRREGRVELHAIIGTDGSIQSLQVVAGDPLFVQSAMEAVQQWHYKPTYLNGQAVEIDTYITVVYTMKQ